MKDDEKTFAHESYGMVGLCRANGAGRLFGSSLNRHHSTIRLRVVRAERKRSLSQDWFHARGPSVVEIELSAAQFAEFVTTPNVGDGVPCTIRTIGSARMGDPPDEHTTEVEEIRVGIGEQMGAIAKRLDVFTSEVDVALEAKSLTRESRDKIRRSVAKFVQEVRSNVPFIIDQLHEAAEKTVTAAKAEADAWLTRTVLRAGLKALGAASESEAFRELPAHEVKP